MEHRKQAEAGGGVDAPRCLFLACSGVRVKSAELAQLGVTLPGFVERGKVIASLPSLALLTLAAHTPKHWRIEYREVAVLEAFDAVAAQYDIVAISSYTAQINMAYAIADQLRLQGVKVVLGGLHVSAMPDEAQAHADAIVTGEGEYAWQALCDDFDRGMLKPRYNAADYGPFDFRDARVPRYDLLDMSQYNRITVQAQRGCPRHCDFCAASHTISNYKCKPVEQVVAEIAEIARHWPHPFIELADDNTFINRAWAKELMRAMIPLGIRWFTETDLSVAEDDELLELISRAGCYQVLIGLESAHGRALRGADPNGWKHRQFARYKEAVAKIQSYGISVNGCFIFGWDDDEPGVFDETVRFVRELELAEVQVTVLTPFPGTPLQKKLRKEGRLLAGEYWDSCTLFDVNFVPARMTVPQLEQGLQAVFTQLYNEKETQYRHEVFKECVKRKYQLRKRVA